MLLKYIDKRAITISAIKDYENMKKIIEFTSDEVKELRNKILSPHSSVLVEGTKSKNYQSNETKIVNTISKINMLDERYKTAEEFMLWFEPAWQSLEDDERSILYEFYQKESQKSGATLKISLELNYSESHVERLRSRALKNLTILLFGK